MLISSKNIFQFLYHLWLLLLQPECQRMFLKHNLFFLELSIDPASAHRNRAFKPCYIHSVYAVFRQQVTGQPPKVFCLFFSAIRMQIEKMEDQMQVSPFQKNGIFCVGLADLFCIPAKPASVCSRCLF